MVEGARLESVCTHRVPWVRIPPSPLYRRTGTALRERIELDSVERCPSGRRGAPGERVYPKGTVGSNPTLSVAQPSDYRVFAREESLAGCR